MGELQWALLIVCVVLVVALYVLSRRGKSDDADDATGTARIRRPAGSGIDVAPVATVRRAERQGQRPRRPARRFARGDGHVPGVAGRRRARRHQQRPRSPFRKGRSGVNCKHARGAIGGNCTSSHTHCTRIPRCRRAGAEHHRTGLADAPRYTTAGLHGTGRWSACARRSTSPSVERFSNPVLSNFFVSDRRSEFAAPGTSIFQTAPFWLSG